MSLKDKLKLKRHVEEFCAANQNPPLTILIYFLIDKGWKLISRELFEKWIRITCPNERIDFDS